MPRTGRPREFDIDAALNAAVDLFWERGYESTTLTELREAMEISSASFYAAFRSKDELFAAAVERYCTTFGQVTDAIADSAIAPRVAVEQILRQSVTMQTDRSHPSGCLLVLAATTCAKDNDRVRELLRERREGIRRDLQRCVERAISNGDLPTNTDSSGLASTFDTFLWGISTEARDGITSQTLDDAIGHIMQVWDTLL